MGSNTLFILWKAYTNHLISSILISEPFIFFNSFVSIRSRFISVSMPWGWCKFKYVESLRYINMNWRIYIGMDNVFIHWDAAVHYGIQLAQYCDQTLSCSIISRRSPPLCSLALRLRNTKVPVWTHESIGYPKMDIGHGNAASHNGIQLAQYCDPTRTFNIDLRKSSPPPPPPRVREHFNFICNFQNF